VGGDGTRVLDSPSSLPQRLVNSEGLPGGAPAARPRHRSTRIGVGRRPARTPFAGPGLRSPSASSPPSSPSSGRLASRRRLASSFRPDPRNRSFSCVFYCDRATTRSNTPAEIGRSARQRRRRDDRLRRDVIPGRVVQRPEESLTTRGSDPRTTPGAFPRTRVVRADRPGPNAEQEADCATGEGDRRTPPRVQDVRRQADRCAIRPPHAARGWGRTPFSPGPASLAGKGPDPCPLDDLLSPAPTRFLARGGGPTGVARCGRPRSHTRPRPGPCDRPGRARATRGTRRRRSSPLRLPGYRRTTTLRQPRPRRPCPRCCHPV
jgi:hypothetical protein